MPTLKTCDSAGPASVHNLSHKELSGLRLLGPTNLLQIVVFVPEAHYLAERLTPGSTGTGSSDRSDHW
jgi:hypothetical protein